MSYEKVKEKKKIGKLSSQELLRGCFIQIGDAVRVQQLVTVYKGITEKKSIYKVV